MMVEPLDIMKPPPFWRGVIFVYLLYREINTYSTVIEKVIVAEYVPKGASADTGIL